MKKIFGFIIVLFASIAFAVSSDIVALVNDEPITKYDFEARKNMVVELNEVDLSDSLTELKLNHEILNTLIEEELLRQHANKAGAEISQEEITEAINTIEKRNNMEQGGMSEHLKSKGIHPETFEKQVKGELIKHNIINSLSGGVSVSQNEVNMALVNSEEQDFKIEAWVFTSKNNSDQTLKQMKNLKQRITSCDKVNSKIYDVFADAEKFDRKLKQVPDRTRSVVSDTKTGTSSQVYIEDDKFKLVFVCKKDSDISSDDLNKVMHFLSNKKMSQKAVKFFKDLKSKAYIQTFSTK